MLILLITFLSLNPCYGQIQDTTIYNAPDTYPEFRYGNETSTIKSLEKYFCKNFQIPIKLIDNGYSGRVFVEFVIEKDGSISQAKVLRGMGDDLDKEVLVTIKKMPKWISGANDGKAVRTHFSLPVPLQWLYCRLYETDTELENQK